MRINTCFGGRKLGIMASSARGSTTRLPENQLREREKDGRIRRFIWDVLTLRMLAYVFAQPATFTFIVSFLFITVSMPPMAAYIRNADQLPDLDTMRSWNAYLGRLPSMGLCVGKDTAPLNLSTSSLREPVASACVEFHVDSIAVGAGAEILVTHLTGEDLRTKIKDSVSGERIDHLVNVALYVSLRSGSGNSSGVVTGCLEISAPPTATPSRHPQIPNTDFTFRTRVLRSVNGPEEPGPRVSCYQYLQTQLGSEDEDATVVLARTMTLGDGCSDVWPHREKYRKKGLINIYLTEEQKEESYVRILLGTLGVAVIGLAFAIGIGCTERPPKPKNRPE